MVKQFVIDSISVDITAENGRFEAAPGQNFPVELGTYSETARMTHASGWIAFFAVVKFPQAEKLMGRFVLDAGAEAPPLDRLKTAGNLDVQEQDGRWVCTIRAMRQPRGKQWATLHQVTLEELDVLAGTNFELLIGEFGVTTVGRYGDLNPRAGKNTMNGLGMQVEKGNFGAIAAMVAVTRPLALLKGLS